jgi:hypothetical protein
MLHREAVRVTDDKVEVEVRVISDPYILLCQ